MPSPTYALTLWLLKFSIDAYYNTKRPWSKTTVFSNKLIKLRT
jgi:hypothetical protein